MLRRLWPYLRPDSWAFALALVLTPATAGLSLVQPWILKRSSTSTWCRVWPKG